MTANSLPQSAVVLAEVEAFIDSLPAKRSRKRAKSENNTPADTTPTLEHAALVELHLLLWQLGRAQNVTTKIYNMVGLTADGAAYEEAMARAYRKGGR